MKFLLDLLGLGEKSLQRRVPILGVEGFGESSLIIRLGQ